MDELYTFKDFKNKLLLEGYVVLPVNEQQQVEDRIKNLGTHIDRVHTENEKLERIINLLKKVDLVYVLVALNNSGYSEQYDQIHEIKELLTDNITIKEK